GSKRSPDPTRGSAETRARPPAATTLHHRQQEGRSMATETTRDDAIARVVESATRLGVELDEAEAAEWVAAMETEASGGELVVDVDSGVYGHRVTMLDFQPEDLARFREMALVVGFEDRP